MTREEAIANLKMISVAFVEPVTKEQGKLIDDTFDMAIRALEQEPCEDCISRQELKKMFREKCVADCSCCKYCSDDEWCEIINELPSVQPKTGTWRKDIDNSRRWDRVRFYCSECGSWQTYGETDFCPTCGARMIKPQESEE